MVRQLRFKEPGRYTRRISVLGREYVFNPGVGILIPEGEYWDKVVEALLSVPEIELVSGSSAPPSKKEELKPETPQPVASKPVVKTSGVQNASVSIEDSQVRPVQTEKKQENKK